MLLKLTNFKNWENRSLEFKPGLTIITGKSGNGKTSFFKAIVFVLSNSKRRCQTFGKRSCSVSLAIDNMKIIRNKGPNKLIVEKDDQIYSDAEAQNLIDQKFGKFFDICNYIPQKGFQSFMYLSNTDKLKFLESFILDDIQSKKENIKEKIKNLSKELVGNQAKTQVFEKYECPEKVICEYDPSIFFTTLDELEIEYSKYYEIKKNNDRIKKRIQELKDKKFEIQEIDLKYYDELNDILPHLIKKDNLECGLNKIVLKLPIVDETDYSHDLFLHEKYTQLKKEFKSIPKVEKVGKKRWKCPNCSEILWMDNDSLIPAQLHEELEDLQIQDISVQEMNQRRELYEKRQKLKQELQNFEEYDKECVQKANLQKQQQTKLIQIQTQIELQEKENLRIEEELKNIPNYSKNRSEVSQELHKIRKMMENNEKIEYQRNLIQEELKSLVLEDFDEIIFENLKTKYNEYKSNQSIVYKFIEYQKNMKKYNQIQSELKELQKEETVLLEKSEALSHILTTIKISENLAIMECVNQLNVNSKLYLDSFFSSPIKVELKTFKEVKGKQNPQIQTNIFMNGTSEYDFSDLSGGEKDRVALAFTLALTEMSPIQLILLDEAISSLDENTFFDVIKGIRTYFKGDVVMTGQQVSTGLFDHSIKI